MEFPNKICSGIASGVIGPLVLGLFAKNLFKELKDLTIFSTKILGLFTTFITSIFIYFSQDILFVWLGEEFIQFKWLFITILFHLGFNLAVSSIININIAYGKVKIPGFVALGTGLLNIILGTSLLLYTDLGLFSVAISGLIALTLKNFLFTPIYAAKIMGLNLMVFYKPIIPSILLLIGIILLSVSFPSTYFNIENSVLKLVLFSCIFAGGLGILIYKFFLSSKEIEQLINLAKSKKNK